MPREGEKEKKGNKKTIETRKEFADSAKLLPKNPLATGWLNMEQIRKSPGGEEFYKTPRDPFQTITQSDITVTIIHNDTLMVMGDVTARYIGHSATM